MQTNVGLADRVVRVALGLVVLSLPVIGFDTSWVYIAVVPFGLVPLLTGVFGICPLYTILGVNTLGKQPDKP